jgi:uncharacterized membrane protein YidH (DUF202 family)
MLIKSEHASSVGVVHPRLYYSIPFSFFFKSTLFDPLFLVRHRNHFKQKNKIIIKIIIIIIIIISMIYIFNRFYKKKKKKEKHCKRLIIKIGIASFNVIIDPCVLSLYQ